MSSALNAQVTPTPTGAVNLASQDVAAAQAKDQTTAIYIAVGLLFFWFFMKK
jgi:hypothetical protein